MRGEKLDPVEGPVSLMMATTATSLHPEDQSRILVLNIPEDSNRVKEAILSQALGMTRAQVPIDRAPWLTLAEMVERNTKEVHLPFARKLAENTHSTNNRMQRDFPKLLAIIKACALVHQRTRDK